jgi:hypothetical protein
MGLAVRIEVPDLQPYHYNAALPILSAVSTKD